MVNLNPFGLLFVLPGLIASIWPYRVARLRETLNAIGSTRSLSDVEPAGWNVTLTRIIGIVAIVVGLAVLFGVIPVQSIAK